MQAVEVLNKTISLKTYHWAIVLFIVLIQWGCQKTKDFSDVPYLEFRSFSKMEMKPGSINQDSVL